MKTAGNTVRLLSRLLGRFDSRKHRRQLVVLERIGRPPQELRAERIDLT